MSYFDPTNIRTIKYLKSGSFGDVYQAKNIVNGKKYAIKVINKKKMDDDKLEAIKSEIRIIMSMSHPHIIKAYYVMEDDVKYRIYMDLFSGDLASYYKLNGKFSERDAYLIFRQLVSAVNYLHNKRHIVHGDIKLQNVLFNNEKDMNVVLADFGLSYRWKPDDPLVNDFKGTLTYMAPEIRSGIKYQGYPADIFSLGVLLFNISFAPDTIPKYDGTMNKFKYVDLVDKNDSNY